MKEIEENRTMTVDEILQDSSLAYMHEFVRKVQNIPASQLIPRKHEKVLTSVTEIETRTLFLKNPNLPIKKVITTIFEDLTDDIPPSLMLKLTKKIIDTWAKLSVAQKENTSAFAA
jgi:hypothetical protein